MDSFCQTEDIGDAALSLDQKMRSIDLNYMNKVSVEKSMPYKTLEERMMKYKHECDLKY